MKMLLVLVSYAAVTILVCSPFLSLWNLGAVPVMEGDVCLHLWTTSWINHALYHQPLRLFQANIFIRIRTACHFPNTFLVVPYWFFPGISFPRILSILTTSFFSPPISCLPSTCISWLSTTLDVWERLGSLVLSTDFVFSELTISPT